MLKYLGTEYNSNMLTEGIYISWWDHNFDHALEATGFRIIDKYGSEAHKRGEDRDFYHYGVCDDYSQILSKYPQLQTDKEKWYVVGLTPVIKANEPEWGGWRWHKWGEYIGVHEPQHEYLAHEEGIEKVYTFEIYEVESK